MTQTPAVPVVEPGAAPVASAAVVDTRAALERLPKWAIVILPVAQWLVLSLRHRAAVLPSAANPAITAGGLVGEGKTEYFAIMGPRARAATARNGSFVVGTERPGADALRCLRDAGLDFPIVAKPDIGWCGFGVRRIDSPAQLADYVAAFPPGERVVLQAYVPHEGEAGIFYARPPGEPGRVLGLALRHFPRVVGDGHHTVAQLIAADARLQRLRNPLHTCAADMAQVPASGQVLRLSTVGSSRVGGLYCDGASLITPALVTAIDAIASDMREFHFGRFDVRYASEDALKAGEGFSIIEVNGAGSEAIEAWDPRTPLAAGMCKILAKQAMLFRIAAANRRRGFAPMRLRELARLHRRQQALIPRYPPSN